MEKKRNAGPGRRKIVVDGETWTYSLGRQFARIVSPNGATSCVVGLDKVAGCTPDDIERIQDNHCPGVGPAEVARYVRERLAPLVSARP